MTLSPTSLKTLLWLIARACSAAYRSSRTSTNMSSSSSCGHPSSFASNHILAAGPSLAPTVGLSIFLNATLDAVATPDALLRKRFTLARAEMSTIVTHCMQNKIRGPRSVATPYVGPPVNEMYFSSQRHRPEIRCPPIHGPPIIERFFSSHICGPRSVVPLPVPPNLD